jgi:hypothetical protein
MEKTLGHEKCKRIPDDPYGAIVKALMDADPRPPIKEHQRDSAAVALL